MLLYTYYYYILIIIIKFLDQLVFTHLGFCQT